MQEIHRNGQATFVVLWFIEHYRTFLNNKKSLKKIMVIGNMGG
jgi:hypothetical protein